MKIIEGCFNYNYLIYPQYWNTDGKERAGLPNRVLVALGATGSWPS